MAATDARPIPKKNTAYRVTFPILDADGDLVTGATGLDSEVSIDGGTFADAVSEATEIATASGMYFLDLTAAEMNGDTIAIIVKTSTSGAKTTPIVLYPEEAGDIRVDVTMISGDATAADNAESFFDGAGYAGTNNVIPIVTTTVNLTTNNDKAGYGLSAAAVQAIWDALTAALTTAGSIGKLLVDNINATISSRSTVTTAQVNAEVLDVLNVDTFAEPAGVPAATTTLQAMLHWLFTLARNERRTTATSDLVRNDANGATIGTATLSDDNTTFTRGEYS